MSTTRRRYRSGTHPVKRGGMLHISEILQKLAATDPSLAFLNEPATEPRSDADQQAA
ncbi:MAG: hypothetical protein H0U67_14750 [Gemmatimonadetes bacterium]|nr:hypothetical protein [Gemmatimonadota bacterium]